jgi:accessory gene regulator protein AgrB
VKPIGWLMVILSWVLYILLSGAYFLKIYLFAIANFKKLNIIPQKMKKDIMLQAVVVIPLTAIIPFLYITIFQVNHLIWLVCLGWQAIFFLFFMGAIFLPQAINEYTSPIGDEEQELV